MIDYMQKQTKLIEEAFNTDTRFTTARDKVISRFWSFIWDFYPKKLTEFSPL